MTIEKLERVKANLFVAKNLLAMGINADALTESVIAYYEACGGNATTIRPLLADSTTSAALALDLQLDSELTYLRNRVVHTP
jgi:hypothetical protein